jgi:predicted O-linked N-acetylglucosamine transferase (SPINDLY family)
LRPRQQVPTDSQRRASELTEEGNALEDTGELDAAQQRYVAAIELAPDWPKAHLNLGNVLLAKTDLPGAFAAYSKTLELDAGYAPAHYNLGNVHFQQNQLEAAIACYRRALRFKADFVDAEVALGVALETLGRFAEAVTSYGRALALRPDYIPVYKNLADTLHKQNDLVGALNCLRQILAARPDDIAATKLAYQFTRHLCEWSDHEALENALRNMVQRGVADMDPFDLLTLEPWGLDTASLQLQSARQYALKKYGAALAMAPTFKTSRTGTGRLRIGYLSADFHNHATMRLLKGVLAAHDHEKFAIYGYSYGPIRDVVTDEVERAFDVFRDVSKVFDRDVATIIATDEIDILVDLKGFTGNARLGIQAMRPAPVLVSWLGYPGSLGHPGLADYLIGDPVVTPPEHAAHYSETLALMPHCYQPNDRHRVIGPKPTRAQVGLPASGIVFCNFNQSFKLSPRTLDLWCQILSRVPGSVLWVLALNDALRVNLRREVQARGVDSDRLVFCMPAFPEDHLGRLQLADLALDTYPYTSHTTASDALWVGVPIPTRVGPTFPSRVAASLLQADGVPELITHSDQEYVGLVTALALDAPRLQALRGKIIALRPTSRLFDTERFARDLERLYQRIWAQHRAGQRGIIRLDSSS